MARLADLQDLRFRMLSVLGKEVLAARWGACDCGGEMPAPDQAPAR